MMDYSHQNDFATLGSTLARTYANAALRTFLATASNGLLLWSGFLAASIPKAGQSEWQSSAAIVESVMRMSPFAWMTPESSALLRPMWSWTSPVEPAAIPAPAASLHPPEAAPPSGFASYRSAGGHASAQVIAFLLPKPNA